MTADPYGQPSANPDPLAPMPGPLDSPGYATYDPLTGAPLSAPPPAPLPYSAAPMSAPMTYTAPPPAYPQAAGVPPVYGAAYPPAGYQAPYPPPYQAPFPAAPGYPMMYPGYPMAPVKPRRPGAATGSAVLAFVQSGLNIIGGFVLFGGGSALTNEYRYGYDDSSYPLVSAQSLTILGIGALVSGGLLIAGGATLLGRRTALLIIGTLLSLGISAYIAVAISGIRYVGFALWAPLTYAVLPIISLCLLFGSDIRRWLRER